MSKQDNLTDFLTDVADAIRAKKGSSEKINPQNFSEEIRSIECGSTEVEDAPFNEVNFYDVDGRRLYSYSAEEFLQLMDMPPLPKRKGLICKWWNWDYDTAIQYVRDYGLLDVGAIYDTDDGKTHIHLDIGTDAPLTYTLKFSQSVSHGVVIDWGDGVIETLEGTGNLSAEHTYTVDKSVITLYAKEGTYGLYGTTYNSSLFGEVNSNKVQYYSAKAVEVGAGCNIAIYTFAGFVNLSYVSLNESSTINTNGLFRDNRINCVILPRSLQRINVQPFYTFVSKVILSQSINNYNAQAFIYATYMQRLVIPEGVTYIPQMFTQSAAFIRYLVIPKTVSKIAQASFNAAPRLMYVKFPRHTSIPTLENVSAFNNTTCQFIVPDALYDEWIVATNWSTYADRIVKASEYQPNNE